MYNLPLFHAPCAFYYYFFHSFCSFLSCSFTALPPLSLPQNLLQVGSAILAGETRPHWELIQQTEGGTAALLRQYEEYTNTLAQNMRKTYLSPFTIVTPNIGQNCPEHS